MNKQEIEKTISYWSEFKTEIKDLRKQHPYIDWDEQEKAVDLAIEALEKQVRKKPISAGEEYSTYYCPCCRKHMIINQFNYCPDCGQAIDWGDKQC